MSHAPPTHTRRRCSSSRGRTRRVDVWPWGHVPLNLPVWRNNPDTITKRKMAAPVLVTPRFALAIANARDAGSRAGGLRSLCLDARVPTVRPGGRIGRARTMPRVRSSAFSSRRVAFVSGECCVFGALALDATPARRAVDGTRLYVLVVALRGLRRSEWW